MQACEPENEAERLEALRRYGILDTPPEAAFDDITRLAARICEAPIAVINLIDRGRQWFKSEIGLGVRETPLDVSICAHALLQPGLFIVPDTREDPRFRDNPLVTGAPHLRFYAGALLETGDGYPLGTLCVLDYVPRTLTEHQKDALRALARQVMTQLELRRHLALQADALAEREAVERRLAAAYAREKRIAETLQRSMLLKPRAGAFPGLAVDMIYEAAWDEAQVGGDFFDAFALGEGRVALVVGDVSGKGLQAAALTAEVKFALRVYLREAGSPSEALRRLNDYLCEPRDPAGSGDAPGTSFVTIALAVVEPEHGRVRIAGGGTEPILIARRGREELGEPVTVEPVKPDGFPLGIERGAAYPGAEAHLGSGDLLLMMTDGVTEARHAGEFFGMEGVEQSVREILAGGGPGAAGGVPDPLEVAERVRDAARDFARGTLRDDACVLVARRDRR